MQIEQFAYNTLTHPEQLAHLWDGVDPEEFRQMQQEMNDLSSSDMTHICFTLNQVNAEKMAEQSRLQQFRERKMSVQGASPAQRTLMATGSFFEAFRKLGVPGLAMWIKVRGPEKDEVLLVVAQKLKDRAERWCIKSYRFELNEDGPIAAYGILCVEGQMDQFEVLPKLPFRPDLTTFVQFDNLNLIDKDGSATTELDLASALMKARGTKSAARRYRRVPMNDLFPIIHGQNGCRYEPKPYVVKSVHSVEEAVYGQDRATDIQDDRFCGVAANVQPGHVAPKYAFSPRGRHWVSEHLRRYKTGKVVVIAAHFRGQGDRMTLHKMTGETAA